MIAHVINAYFWNPLDKIRMKMKFFRRFYGFLVVKDEKNGVNWLPKAVILEIYETVRYCNLANLGF